ncbi:MAG TPA: acetyl-CoA carboxylase, carboxyltransferase subunit beta [Thermomicrobiales bacterium]|nr:acetyl-CoA carboxylase, carboxyltransferase subunit beta [Thermomicrobiales bacterium]
MRELIFRRQPRFRPGRSDEQQTSVPDDLWRKCPGCGDLIYTRELERSLHVCPKCGHHFRLSSGERIELLADPGTFEPWDANLRTADPLGFTVGEERYAHRARSTAERAGIDEALITGRIEIDGRPLAVAVTDFAFMGASMGSVYGEKLARACRRAVEGEMPLLTVNSSGGARMQEGLFSLMQMAKTTAAFDLLRAARLPHISLLVDPCYGGVTASYATTADVIIAEPGARIGFAGPRVIEQVTRQKLPEGFQSAEFLLEHGMIDRVVPRAELRPVLGRLMAIFAPGREQAEAPEGEAVTVGSGTADERR